MAGSANTGAVSVSKPELASTRPSTARAARPMGACLSRASRVARSVAAADTTCSVAAPRRQLPESTPGDWGVLARGILGCSSFPP